MNEKTAFMGFVRNESPLRHIFGERPVPLSSPAAVRAYLGLGKEAQAELVYFVTLEACSVEEKEGIALLMHQMGQGSIEEARKVVWTEREIPVRASNFNGVGFPLRYLV